MHAHSLQTNTLTVLDWIKTPHYSHDITSLAALIVASPGSVGMSLLHLTG